MRPVVRMLGGPIFLGSHNTSPGVLWGSSLACSATPGTQGGPWLGCLLRRARV
ncbi:hypothetical protein BDV25DRAFT_82051 [Aspergillus avenaceus]|uniref:Uncharacterized protein n=1 Tax=Aspergillus avenaceus TaxID=36643 RepID=A0A5N6U831_ASPAV|nr:hypothetical protein BDV25DRAFT_82051 [Aspergillus avenaceus]